MKPTKNYKILVVEDNSTHFEMLQTILQKTNHLRSILNLERAKTKSEALFKAFKNDYDLYICDVILQDNYDAGFEICRELKNDNKKKHIPIILLTRRLIDPFDSELNKGIADDYIQKPYNNGEIVESIVKLLNIDKTNSEIKFCKKGELAEV